MVRGLWGAGHCIARSEWIRDSNHKCTGGSQMAKSSQARSLVIVESPAKAKTINKYLGAGFEVLASMGHVRDLPSKGLSVDIEAGFEPTYEITPGKKRTVNSLKAAAKKCDRLFLATDLDREGEAIAWHLAQILNMPEQNTYRVVFNSITKNAIQQAFANPGKLDIHRVMAQQARRVLDRIVGYQISPLLWKKVARGLSAGRVQSVAVRMIVEKEREIRAFQPQEYWLIPAVFSTDTKADYSDAWKRFLASAPDAKKERSLAEQYQWLAEHKAFKAELHQVDGQKFHSDNRDKAERIFAALQTASFYVRDVTTKRISSRPSPPFITSTLQQAAANRLGFSAHRTMRIAQQLYEGIDLGSMGALGLITYMRTDSTFLSQEAVISVRRYIEHNIGPAYVPDKPNYYASSKNAQQAHEAIRPTDPDLTPQQISQFLTEEQFKLYDLVWRRFVSCQMSPAQWDTTSVEIAAETSLGTCLYRTTGRILVFDGFTRIWPTSADSPELPPMKAQDRLGLVDLQAEQHFTKPPARYTEASLVKALEKEGIGRPSTYASIITTIQDRGYVEKIDRKFRATDIGEVVTDKLCEFFPRVMDIAFTRHMESQLDKIEEQHLEWVRVLEEFYKPFKVNLDEAADKMKHAKAETQPSDYTCPECGKPMVYRFGKNGRFLSCSTYPTCKFACPCDRDGKRIEEQPSEHLCPNCGKPMIQKTGRFGGFLGCSDYPNCKTIQRLDKQGNIMPPKPPAELTGIPCYKCKNGELVIRQSKRGPFLGCNKFPRCRTIVSMKQLDRLRTLQQEGRWPPESPEQARELLGAESENKPKKSKKAATKKKKKQ
ncbi:MAG: type I DNA topoisomerase [Sedimentisphaerales bacterium]|nr:type I DNA topoisomerase [Sedimentisphaerales bacterium]